MTKPSQPLLSPHNLTLFAMIAVVALTRLLPHPPNFTPVESMALFAGACLLDRRLALLAPLLAMAVSDLALGMIHGGYYSQYLFSLSHLSVYACIVLCSLAGFAMRGRTTAGRVLGWSLAGAVIFFLVTNFAIWLAPAPLPGANPCAAGLLPCYVAAIPFFKWTVASALFYSALLFGGRHLVLQRWPALAAAR